MKLEEEDKGWIYFYCTAAIYAIYYMVPFDDHAPVYRLYPLAQHIEVSIATYAHYACGNNLVPMLFVLALQRILNDPEREKTFKILFWFEVLRLANQLLRYGESFSKEHEWLDMNIPRLIVYGWRIAIEIKRNRRNRRLKYEVR